MSPEKEAEYEKLLNFLEFFDKEGYIPLKNSPPDTRSQVEKISAQYGKSKALLGLRQAINDILEMTSSRSVSAVQEFDSKCRAVGVNTLSEYRIQYWSKYKRVLEKGKISNLEQFYMLTAIANDMYLDLGTSERKLLNDMLNNYSHR